MRRLAILLLLVGKIVAIRQIFEYRRPASRERKCRSLDRFAVGSLQTGFDLERAPHAGRQIAFEVEYPVLLIGPARRALLGAIDIERFGQARIAERHHCVREARCNLAHALHFALRREDIYCGRMGQCGRKSQRRGNEPGRTQHDSSRDRKSEAVRMLPAGDLRFTEPCANLAYLAYVV